ncbi:MAG: hypothetical protein J1F11_13375 [Oscillospiraceae bacterium]|nr:hypothetical protein [Oscillospiraceae bacterium]
MEETNDKMREMMLIQSYADLQRIKNANNRDAEIEYQLKIVEEKLKYMGFNLSKLPTFDAI